MRNSLYFFAAIFLLSFSSYSQNEDPINITGVILDAENMEPIPFTSVLIGDGRSGTVADNSGYFSFLAYPGDSITFRSVGYQKSSFVIPSLLEGKTYSLIELMVRENVLLDEITVYPLPDVDYFTNTIVRKELTDTQKKQLNDFKKDLDNIVSEQNRRNGPYYDQWRYARLYEMTGLVPPNNFLNPMTWSNFIRDWKENNKK
jgi:hypothetical protein